MQIRQEPYAMGYGGYSSQDTAGWGSAYAQTGIGGAGALGGGQAGSSLGQNIVNTALSVAGGGWKFTGEALAQLYGASNSWQQASSGGLPYLQIKPGVAPSDAIDEVFANPMNFAFDCATSTAVILLKAQLDTIGPQAFNSMHSQSPMVLAGWADTSGTDFFMGRGARFVGPGEVTLNGNSTQSGELAPFDASMGDRLTPGGVYYFERPGDTTTFNQGWNAIYLGGSGNIHQFWRVEDGVHTVDLREQNNLLIDVSGKYNNEYLSSSVMSPLI